MRGALRDGDKQSDVSRIIPADAGSTIDGTQTYCSLGDHPRGCGEHLRRVDQPVTPVGSSPRMRGALTVRVHVLCDLGIIPADAGST